MTENAEHLGTTATGWGVDAYPLRKQTCSFCGGAATYLVSASYETWYFTCTRHKANDVMPS